MDIYDGIDGMRVQFRDHDWLTLEQSYARLCAEHDPTGSVAIAAIDLADSQTELESAVRSIASGLAVSDAAAVYWEFDIDSGWTSRFFLCSRYEPEAAGDDDWATDFDDDHVVEGPDLPAFGDLFDPSWDRSAAVVARNLFLIARTLACFGRAAEAVWNRDTPLCAGYHDQDVVFRWVG